MVQFTFLLAAAAFTFLLLLFLLLFPCGTDYIRRRRRRSLQGRPDHPPTEVEVEAVVQTPPHSPHGKEKGGIGGGSRTVRPSKGMEIDF